MAYLVIPIVQNFQNPDPVRARVAAASRVVGVFLLRGIGSYISEYGMAWTGHRVVFDLRRELVDKLLELPTPYYDTHAGRHRAVEDHVRRAPARVRRRRARSPTAIRRTLTIVGELRLCCCGSTGGSRC